MANAAPLCLSCTLDRMQPTVSGNISATAPEALYVATSCWVICLAIRCGRLADCFHPAGQSDWSL